MKMALDVAMGMNWLHCCDPKVVHSDLKISNILVSEDGRCVVSDFGQAKLLHGVASELNTYGGTPLYMAPEKLMGEAHNEAVDVYSFGLILWELYTRQRAFESYSKGGQLPLFITAVATKGERPTVPPDCPQELSQLIRTCWARDPSTRPAFTEIVETLKECTILCSITDLHARNFWRVNFGNETTVPWSKLKPALRNHLKRPSMLWLKALIAEKDNNYNQVPGKAAKPNYFVRIDTFGTITQYFGPFFPEDGPMNTTLTDKIELLANSRNFLDKVQSTLMSPWFHGDVDSAAAVKLLKSSGHNSSFLVRFSAREPGCFTISRMSPSARDKKITEFVHQRIANTPDGVALTSTQLFPSLAACIGNRKVAEALHLRNPVTPTPFYQLKMRWANKIAASKKKEEPQQQEDATNFYMS